MSTQTLMAPQRSFWLMRELRWMGDLEDFRERMRGRLERIENNRDNYDVAAE